MHSKKKVTGFALAFHAVLQPHFCRKEVRPIAPVAESQSEVFLRE